MSTYHYKGIHETIFYILHSCVSSFSFLTSLSKKKPDRTCQQMKGLEFFLVWCFHVYDLEKFEKIVEEYDMLRHMKSKL